MNENKNTTYQNLLDTAKAVLRGKFIVVNIYKKGKSYIKNLNYHLKIQKKEKNKPRGRRRKEIIKDQGSMKLKTEKQF